MDEKASMKMECKGRQLLAKKSFKKKALLELQAKCLTNSEVSNFLFFLVSSNMRALGHTRSEA